MPITEWPIPEHLIAEWNGFNEKTGETVFSSISPEDVLPLMADGYTIPELVAHFDCPQEVVAHVIACIPEMMVWKSKIQPGSGTPGMKQLPTVEGS